ncbi:hypothetical protein EVAR_37719_1 [Eumeta japonica]|uniref:Uncharacterized protein n=1 Tax=Eumeta variegata TaxID=151549 RepID=A0A4C1YQG6_EUMVA|nr:hypothetical protein EVAR_37719_1 [Eumeta japonica]
MKVEKKPLVSQERYLWSRHAPLPLAAAVTRRRSRTNNLVKPASGITASRNKDDCGRAAAARIHLAGQSLDGNTFFKARGGAGGLGDVLYRVSKDRSDGAISTIIVGCGLEAGANSVVLQSRSDDSIPDVVDLCVLKFKVPDWSTVALY